MAIALGVIFAVTGAGKANAFWPFTKSPSYDNFDASDVYVMAISPVNINIDSRVTRALEDFSTYSSGILSGDELVRNAGQCVGWIKFITGVNYSGNAIEWAKHINSDKPVVGSIAVLKVGYWGHIALVQKKDDDNQKVTFRSRNWRGLWKVSSDEFDYNDERILGYIIF